MRTENKNTILIVEDDFIIAMDEKIALEEYGYDVLTAKSGEAAIEIMRGNHPVDLILMDIDLGTGMDGIATAETILKFREIPIAFLSSHTALEIAEKTAKISLYGYIVKNSGIKGINALIKRVLSSPDAERE